MPDLPSFKAPLGTGLAGLGILACLAFSSPGFADELSQEEIKNLVRQVGTSRGTKGISAQFHETRHLPLLDEPVIETGTLKFLPPDKFRKETLGDNPTHTIFNGSILWIVFPKDRFAERYETDSNRHLRESFSTFLSVLDMASAQNAFHITGKRQKNGASQLVLVPRNRRMLSSVTRAIVAVTPNNLISSILLEQPRGGRSHIKLSDHALGGIEASDFEYSPPPSMTVSDPMGR